MTKTKNAMHPETMKIPYFQLFQDAIEAALKYKKNPSDWTDHIMTELTNGSKRDDSKEENADAQD